MMVDEYRRRSIIIGHQLILSIIVLIHLVDARPSLSNSLPGPPVFAGPVLQYPSICYLPPDSALCSSSTIVDIKDDDRNMTTTTTHYYFDISTYGCYAFYAESCGGNANNFATIESCRELCKPVK
jgi:hypothetical protein